MLIIILVTSIAAGKYSPLNSPYVSWKNVHDGAGGLLPGASLSTILQTTASSWSTNGWTVFDIKWDEWLYVLHAIIFFAVFGTTPEMRQLLLVRLVVRSGALWIQKAASLRRADSLGRHVQLESRSTNGKFKYQVGFCLRGSRKAVNMFF